MRFSQPVRMADGGEASPVWARSRKRSGMPIVGLLVTLLALFGALTAVLGIKERLTRLRPKPVLPPPRPATPCRRGPRPPPTR
mgnify:CR=1 FL=1